MAISRLSLIGAISALTVVGGTVGIVYGLGDRSDKDYSQTYIKQKNIYRRYVNTATGRSPDERIYEYNIDSNIQSLDSTNIASNYIQMSLPLLRLTRDYENRTVYENDGKIKTQGTDSYKFEGADSIIIGYELKGKQETQSFDSKNINDKEEGILKFFNDINDKSYKLLSIAFTIRDNLYWTDSSGNKTEYKLTAEDYYYGLRSALLRDSLKLRSKHGASSSLEDGKNLINGISTDWNNSGNYYLFDVFNVNIKYDNIPKSAFPLESKTQKELFKVEMGENNKNKPDFILNKLFFGMRLFTPQPSAYIKDILEKERKEEIVLHEAGERDAKDLGIYWYGRTKDYDYANTSKEFFDKYGSKSPSRSLFVGPYIPGYRDDLRVEMVKNPGYWDQEWYKSEKTIEKFVTYYQKVDKEQFKKAEIQRYKLGYTVSVDLSIMNQNEQVDVYKNPEKYGFNWSRQQNYPGNIGQITRAAFPTDTKLDSINEDGYFNLNALNIIYGTSIKEQEIKDTMTKKTIKDEEGKITYIPDLSDIDSESTKIPTTQNNAFLNALLATVNWENLIKGVEGYDKLYWSNLIVPTIDFPGLDDGEKFIDLEESSSYYVKYKENEIKYTSKQNKDMNETDESKNIRSYKYDDLVQLINKILEDAKNNNIIDVTKPIKFNLPYRFTSVSKKHDTIMKKVESIINSIEINEGLPKIQFSFAQPKDRDSLLSLISKDSNIFTFGGWGHDYNSYSTYLAYYFLYNDGIYKSLDDDSENSFVSFLKQDVQLKNTFDLMKDINDNNYHFSKFFYESLIGHGMNIKNNKIVDENDKNKITYEYKGKSYLNNITDLLNYFHFINLKDKSVKNTAINYLKNMNFKDGSKYIQDLKIERENNNLLLSNTSNNQEILEALASGDKVSYENNKLKIIMDLKQNKENQLNTIIKEFNNNKDLKIFAKAFNEINNTVKIEPYFHSNDIYLEPNIEFEDEQESSQSNYYNYWSDNFNGKLASNIVLSKSSKWESEKEEYNKNTLLYLKDMFGGSVDIANNIIDDLSKARKTVRKNYLYNERTSLEIPYLADWRTV